MPKADVDEVRQTIVDELDVPLLCGLAEQHANNGRTMVRDSRYVTNTGYSGAESLVISRFRCTTQERDVLLDDVHVPDHREALTFYIPTKKLERARDVLPGEVKVLETHEYEYLVKTDI